METWLADIDARFDAVVVKSIGASVEKRSIYVVTINDKFVEKPIILLVHDPQNCSGANPTTLSYNASVVKFTKLRVA
jgi:hypothetical protein